MKVGILKPLTGKEIPIVSVYKKILDHNKIAWIDLDINDQDILKKVADLDLFILRMIHSDDDIKLAQHILPVIQNEMGIKCYPNIATSWHYDNKIKQYYMLKGANFPVVNSFVFWNKNPALLWAEEAEYPVVFKLSGGAGSSNVLLVNTRGKAIRLIKKLFGRGIHPHYFAPLNKFKAFNKSFIKTARYYLAPFYKRIVTKNEAYPNYTRHKNHVYFQEFLPNNKYDTRVTIVGNRGFAFKRFTRKNDFRASGSNSYDMRRNEIDMRMLKIGFEVSRHFGFQSMAYDFIYDKFNNPVIVEISYTYGDYPEFSTGYWDENLNWIDGNYWPEYLELVDALNLPDLIQPKMEVTSSYANAKMVV